MQAWVVKNESRSQYINWEGILHVKDPLFNIDHSVCVIDIF